MIRLPLLRAGRPYFSLETATLADVRTGRPVAEVSQANTGLIAHDLLQGRAAGRALRDLPVAELLEVCRRAAAHFTGSDLPLGEGTQSPRAYLRQLSSTTGLPETLCRENMDKIRFVLQEMEQVLGGLTRGLDLAVLDAGWMRLGPRPVSYLRQADWLGAVLPSNSPGVHSLWLPAIPLKVALALRPGRQEPWTPYRIAQAFLAAGCPAAALGFYPSEHAGATEILLRCERSLLFGDGATVQPWRAAPGVQIHGPGWSKIFLAADCVDDWESYQDLMLTSIVSNGGRSCVNASGIWVAGRGREIAGALAGRLAALRPRPLDHPQASLAAFSRPAQAHQVSRFIDRQLAIPGAEDLTARLRGGPRVVEAEGLTFLLPTLVWCEDADHPLAQAEFLFPFAAVVEMPQAEMLRRVGPTLVATFLSRDRLLQRQALECRRLERLNLGPVPTTRVCWDQPHEGNLFEHLYWQRAFQRDDTPRAGAV